MVHIGSVYGVCWVFLVASLHSEVSLYSLSLMHSHCSVDIHHVFSYVQVTVNLQSVLFQCGFRVSAESWLVVYEWPGEPKQGIVPPACIFIGPQADPADRP